AFPSFGSERTGAPVVSYCRMDDQEIRSREPILDPDAILIQDASLLHQVDLFAGLKESSYVLINTSQTLEQLGLKDLLNKINPRHILMVPATELALKYIGRPLPNAVLLGGFSALSGQISLESVKKAISEKFPLKISEANQKAAEAAYQIVLKEHQEEGSLHA
ncbi:MAG TPA: 2-oxoacid:acceptor oxidoreductase family protein, partial [Pseudobdellovibrionaceae bacterium]|nr:2-oxoacid:acceptor oxidoreductase family protein [Pseudobdellovibrionaceae bacterium]